MDNFWSNYKQYFNRVFDINKKYRQEQDTIIYYTYGQKDGYLDIETIPLQRYDAYHLDFADIDDRIDLLDNEIIRNADFLLLNTNRPIEVSKPHIYSYEQKTLVQKIEEKGKYLCYKNLQYSNKDFIIYVINLERSIKRRTLITDQLKKFGLKYKIITAVDGKKITIVDNSFKFVNKNFKLFQYNNRDLYLGEIGCYLSHYMIYQDFITRSEKHCVVFEDDNDITDENIFKSQLYNIPTIDENFIIVLSGCTCIPFYAYKNKINSVYYETHLHKFNKTNAYIVNKNYAKQLYDFMENIICPADDLIGNPNIERIVICPFKQVCIENGLVSDVNHNKDIPNKNTVAIKFSQYIGLGNKMFMLSACKAQSLKHNMNCCILEHDPELQTIFPNLFYQTDIVPKNSWYERTYPYHQIDISGQEDILLEGYYQSEKHFIEQQAYIYNMFEFNQEILDFCNSVLSTIGSYCSIHLRLADVRGESDFIYTRPSPKFVAQAMSEIIKLDSSISFIVISNDIEEAIKLLPNINNKIYTIHKNKYIDLCLQTKADYNIITSGTFGWWGAYLNKHSKKVIHISPQFNQNLERVRPYKDTDFYLKNWMSIGN